jgi:hypothetical protein
MLLRMEGERYGRHNTCGSAEAVHGDRLDFLVWQLTVIRFVNRLCRLRTHERYEIETKANTFLNTGESWSFWNLPNYYFDGKTRSDIGRIA